MDAVLNVNPQNGVLSNDLPAGLVTGATLDSNHIPQHGTFTLNDDGSFTYEPEKSFFGIDSFSYSIGTFPNTAKVILLVMPMKVTLGSILSVKASEIIEMKNSTFGKIPKLYGVVGGKNGALKKIKDKFTPEEVFGAWGKKYSLYDKKILKSSGYSTYFENNGALTPIPIDLKVKTKLPDKTKVDASAKTIMLVPPVITAITPAGELSPGASLTIEGKYFGDKLPKISLEINGKLLKCKVDKTSLKYTNYKGKPSCMDPETGQSVVTVLLPSKKLEPGTYPLVLDNKVGIATTPFIDENNKGHLPVISIK
jgi:hypothetical protein